MHSEQLEYRLTIRIEAGGLEPADEAVRIKAKSNGHDQRSEPVTTPTS
jgi:hypothetical protein